MISAVVLTRNSENSLPRALKSLVWCDEIVIVDDHSTDNTTQSAREFRVRVYKHKSNGDFAAQRNFALSKVKSEWTLFVDSDEEVSEELAREIQIKLKAPGDVQGFILKREDTLFGRRLKYGETAHVRLLRLGRTDAGKWVRPVHEVWEIREKVEELAGSLEHYPHQTIREFLDEINTYSTINAKHLYDTGQSASVYHVVVYPVAKFFLNYFMYHGFRDGMPGMIVAMMMSFHSFLVRAKLWQMGRERIENRE